MDVQIVQGGAAAVRTGLLVLGIYSEGAPPTAAQEVEQATRGKLSALLKRGDLAEKAGSTLLLMDVPEIAAERVLLVSLGKRSVFDDRAYLSALRETGRALSTTASSSAAVALADVDLPDRSLTWRVQQAALLLSDGLYRFDAPRRVPGGNARGVQEISLLVSEEVDDAVRRAAERGAAIAKGMALTKDLGNLPGNVCNPSYLADTAKSLGKELRFDVEILERSDMERLGMASALSVGRASAQPCKFIVMNYQGANKEKPVVLVGKGVTFDTGGVSLKPGANMDEMKYDMCGAAAVFGAMKTAASLQLPINLIAIVPAVENMPGGDATRPGDVVKSMSGLTIEILDTDAEGRLILCDALTYAERFKPGCVVDVATLTGACVIALGNVTSGLFANDDGLAEELFDCGQDIGDKAWRLPLYDEYLEQLSSNFADTSNLGGNAAGAVTAACFLGRFTKNYKWAHLDIAGTSAISGPEKGATGRPVPLLSEFLFRRADGSRAYA
ncbi:MAG: leucyl aminopeptidase [Myxococcales bacterium]